MKRIPLQLAALAALAVLATGCASTRQFAAFPDQSKAIENPSKARIYVVRPTNFGSAVGMKVFDGEKLIGKTGPKGYLCWERAPGNVSITGKSENKSTVQFSATAGQTYYLQQHVRFGIFYARNKMSRLHPGEGKEKLQQCSPPER